MRINFGVQPIQKRPHAESSMSHASPAERLAHRAEVCVRIEALLEGGEMSVADISDQVGILRSTGQAYLRYMWRQLRLVRKTGQTSKWGRCNWELGADPDLPTADEMLDAAFAPIRKNLPARQIGMQRDPLVTAFFGAPA
jgi:hypothetical protein